MKTLFVLVVVSASGYSWEAERGLSIEECVGKKVFYAQQDRTKRFICKEQEK